MFIKQRALCFDGLILHWVKEKEETKASPWLEKTWSWPWGHSRSHEGRLIHERMEEYSGQCGSGRASGSDHEVRAEEDQCGLEQFI